MVNQYELFPTTALVAGLVHVNEQHKSFQAVY